MKALAFVKGRANIADDFSDPAMTRIHQTIESINGQKTEPTLATAAILTGTTYAVVPAATFSKIIVHIAARRGVIG